MKITLIGINAKYIHTNLAIRLLKANTPKPVKLIEHTIKDSPEDIIKSITDQKPDLIGFSVYIWNVEIIKTIVPIIKEKTNALIVFGGPEVSYEPAHFLDNLPVDYIICGEGEKAFPALLDMLGGTRAPTSVPNLAFKTDAGVVCTKSEEIADLDHLRNPYLFSDDIPHIPNKIQYIESSRGCPFKCSYCLASLEHQVRFFPLDDVKEHLLYLMDQGGKTFKFLDRTFNADIARTKKLIDFIIENHRPDTVFQFEITGDILPESLIDHINDHAPEGLFRFEIGIQSTHDETNRAVRRMQDTKTLFKRISRIKSGGKITLHLDLIAGLPKENLQRFKKTFDDVFALGAGELQLGFLKILRGTRMKLQADRHGYVYDDYAPYEIRSNSHLTAAELDEIHLVEQTLNTYWNKQFMTETIKTVMKHIDSPFEWFLRFGRHHMTNHWSFHRYQLHDLFERLVDFARKTMPKHAGAIEDAAKEDYLAHHAIKPKRWWPDPKNKNDVLRAYHKSRPNTDLDALYKYAMVVPVSDGYLIAIYQLKETIIKHIKSKK